MPLELKYIDQISREKQRDVLAVEFHDKKSGFCRDYLNNQDRKTILDWLDSNDIPYYPCGPFASETEIIPYMGQIYIDIAYDKKNSQYQNVAAFFGNPDGSSKFKEFRLIRYPLEACMKNAHHDEPGFWEAWADSF